jgi:hypothetical protein
VEGHEVCGNFWRRILREVHDLAGCPEVRDEAAVLLLLLAAGEGQNGLVLCCCDACRCWGFAGGVEAVFVICSNDITGQYITQQCNISVISAAAGALCEQGEAVLISVISAAQLAGTARLVGSATGVQAKEL